MRLEVRVFVKMSVRRIERVSRGEEMEPKKKIQTKKNLKTNANECDAVQLSLSLLSFFNKQIGLGLSRS